MRPLGFVAGLPSAALGVVAEEVPDNPNIYKDNAISLENCPTS